MISIQNRQSRIYGTLDLMRGVAALAVVTHHDRTLFGSAALESAYLAVDLFFALSGFVIAHAYGERLSAGMPFRRFLWIRLVRLYPLYLLGLTLGLAQVLISLVFGKGVLSPAEILAGFATGLFMLPAWPGPRSHALFPLLIAAWSLFFEMVANIVAALTWRWLLTPVLIALIVTSGGILVGIGFGGSDWVTFGNGLPRVTFSFFTGILLFRLHGSFPYRLHPLAIAAILLGIFALGPPTGTRALYDIAAVSVVFPLLIVLGANTEPSPRLVPVFASAGAVSYAVYILHMPLLSFTSGALKRLVPDPLAYAPATGVAFLFGLLVFCWLVDRYYDSPVRRLITSVSSQ